MQKKHLNIYDYKNQSTLSEHLALDELLLTYVNSTPKSSGMRFYDSQNLSIVLGLANKVNEHVHLDACNNDNVAILRRCSGGGSIIQGKGCLSYSLYLRYEDFIECQHLNQTTQWILEHVSKAFQRHNIFASYKGVSDVVIDNKKIIGNAQRRLKQACLFHGCILYNFDIDCMARYLKYPPTTPDYRKSRPHSDFVCNLGISKKQLKSILLSIWPSTAVPCPIQYSDIIELSKEKYLSPDWTYCR